MTAETASVTSGLTAELADLGLRRGQDLLVHCSMRQLGPLDGGPRTLLRALQTVTGPDSTVVVPAQTTANSLTSRAFLAATARLDAAALGRFIAAMPGFDPASTPSSGMGAFAEHIRTRPGAVRSLHPQTSFAAVGRRAGESMADHDLECHLGGRSPLGWLYRADAAVLLLGTDYAACTAFHLAEYNLAGEPARREFRCYTREHGRRKERAFIDIDLDDGDFEQLGRRIDREPFVRRGAVGAAECRLLPIRAAVDFAVSWPPFMQRRRAVT